MSAQILTDAEMPAMPEPDYVFASKAGPDIPGYDDEQLRSYARAVEAAVLVKLARQEPPAPATLPLNLTEPDPAGRPGVTWRLYEVNYRDDDGLPMGVYMYATDREDAERRVRALRETAELAWGEIEAVIPAGEEAEVIAGFDAVIRGLVRPQ